MIDPVGGIGQNTPKANSVPASQGQQNATPTQPSSSGPVAETSASSSSSTTSILFDGSSRPTGNVALALWILSALLNKSEDEQDGTDLLLLGLAAGLLAASENKGPSFFFSSSNQTSASTQTSAGPQEVNAAYNTELPSVASDPTSSAGQATPSEAPKIDTSA